MEKELQSLKIRIHYIEDLKEYENEDAILNEAINYAISAINNRCGYTPKDNILYPAKYYDNVIRGALDWLSKLGGSEYLSFSENGVSATFRETPSWLLEVISYVKSF